MCVIVIVTVLVRVRMRMRVRDAVGMRMGATAVGARVLEIVFGAGLEIDDLRLRFFSASACLAHGTAPLANARQLLANEHVDDAPTSQNGAHRDAPGLALDRSADCAGVSSERMAT
jgi:hypothetical protein